MKLVPNMRFTLQDAHLPFVRDNFLSSVVGGDYNVHFIKASCCHSEDIGALSYEEKIIDFKNKLLSSRVEKHSQSLISLSVDSLSNREVNHAVALFLDHNAKRAVFQDSQGNPIPDDVRSVLNQTLPDYDLQDLQIKQQRDNWSCTFYATDNLKRLARGECITENSTDIEAVRGEIQTALLEKWWPNYVRQVNQSTCDEFNAVVSGQAGVEILDISKDRVKFKNADSRWARTIDLSDLLDPSEQPPNERFRFMVDRDSDFAHLDMQQL